MRDSWREIRLGELFEPTNNRLGEHREEPQVLSVTKYAGVVRAEDYFGKRVASANLDTYKVLGPDDWAYSTIHIDEGSIARNRLGTTGVVSPMYTTMRVKSTVTLLPEFCELVLRSQTMLNTFQRRQQGSINRRRSLPWSVFAEIEVPLPPLDEQRRIADLVGALETAIEASERAGTRLAACQRTLVESMPGELVQLGVVLRTIQVGSSPAGIERIPRKGERAVLKVSAVGRDGFVPEQVKVVEPSVPLDPTTSVRDGDVLVVRANGVLSRIGAACLVSGDFPQLYLCDKTFRLISDSSRAEQPWLYFALLSTRARAQIEALATGSHMRNISQKALRQVEIPIPSSTVQRQLLATMTEVSSAMSACKRHAQALRLLRTNVLNALLSGKHEIPGSYDRLLAG